jgi:phosphatidylserine/phosphatidylglycerophosphate/cardiolipin synthase-like enzyme
MYSSFYHRHRFIPIYSLLCLVLCFLLAGCDLNIPGSNTALFSSTSSGTCQANCTAGPGVQGVQIFVEPQAGDHVITDAISNAQKSVWLEMYILTDRNVISGLEEAAHRGVDVRVLLEPHPYGSGSLSSSETLDRLNAAGVQTKAASPSFSLTHEKGMVIDQSTAYITTMNFSLSALGGSSSTTNREYGIIDNNT